MNKKEFQKKLKKMEEQESLGYLTLQDGLKFFQYCSIHEILYYFKKKEELWKKVNLIKK